MTTPRSVTGHRATAIVYGIACHGLFVIGVGTMIAAMYFGMSRSLGTLTGGWRILGNTILLAQFPLLHSLSLTRAGGLALRRLAPAPLGSALATTTYVIIASVQVFLLFALWSPSGTVWWRADGAVLWLLTGLYAAAWLFLLKAISDAGMSLQTGALGWWSVLKQRAPAFPPMPTTGLFRVVRQPIYVAFTLTLWTVPTWTPDQLVVAIVLSAYCLLGPILKEHRFRNRFGPAFAAYARRVPYWLPWPRPAVRPNDQAIYANPDWWGDETRWLRLLRNLVPARFAFFDPIVGDWRGRRVLDLGCGGGFMSEALVDRGAVTVGVDPSEAAIASARRHATGRAGPTYVVATAGALPFADASFDTVVCVDVLEHIDDLDGAIGEIARVLRPGGLFLFDTINRTPVAAFVVVTVGEGLMRLVPQGAHDPAMFIRPDDLRRTLEGAGFRVGPFAGMGPRGLTRRLDVVFGWLPTLAIQYLGQATLSRARHAPGYDSAAVRLA